MRDVPARILEAARSLYVIGGGSICTPAGIAHITGLSPTVVSRSFPDPDDLVYASIRASVDIFRDRLLPLLEAYDRQPLESKSASRIICAVFITLISPQRAADRERLIITLCRAYLESDGPRSARAKLVRDYGPDIASFVDSLVAERPDHYDPADIRCRLHATITAFANLFVVQLDLRPERHFWNTRSAQLVEQMVRLAMSMLQPHPAKTTEGAVLRDVLRLVDTLPLPHPFFGSIRRRLL